MPIENAWLRTLEEGIHTRDIYTETYSQQKVGTKEFADAVIARLGQQPEKFKPVDYKEGIRARIECYDEPKKTLIKKDSRLNRRHLSRSSSNDSL